MTNYKQKLNNIQVFIFDVDGVLTTGEVYLMGDQMVRVLNSRDGYAIQYASKLGYKIFIITGGSNTAVHDRLCDLGVIEVRLRSADKVAVYQELKEIYGFTDEEVLYMGDDIPDYRVMQLVGVSSCPQDAAVEIKSISDYQSPYGGGKNCVRDVIEQTLRVQGRWFTEDAHTW
jgi:3-deoxy-D-manno-octulosonate 8-phosphate phosphatase (KDO 8-P phosphatase)